MIIGPFLPPLPYNSRNLFSKQYNAILQCLYYLFHTENAKVWSDGWFDIVLLSCFFVIRRNYWKHYKVFKGAWKISD